MRHIWGIKFKNLGHSRGTVRAFSYFEHSLGTVEAKLVGDNLRTDEKKISVLTVEAHLAHTFLTGTVGAGLRLGLS